MNKPSTLGGNWIWRMEEGMLSQEVVDRIYHLTRISFRLNGQERKFSEELREEPPDANDVESYKMDSKSRSKEKRKNNKLDSQIAQNNREVTDSAKGAWFSEVRKVDDILD